MKSFYFLLVALLAFTLKPTNSLSLREQVTNDLAEDAPTELERFFRRDRKKRFDPSNFARPFRPNLPDNKPLKPKFPILVSQPDPSNDEEGDCSTNFEKSLKVQGLLRESSENWKDCDANFKPARDVANSVENGFDALQTGANGVSNVIDRVAQVAKAIDVAANKALKAFTAIPKVGKIIQLILDVIEQAEEIISKVGNSVGKVADYLKKIHLGSVVVAAELEQMSDSMQGIVENMDDAVEVQKGAVACTKKSKTCSDDAKVEAFNSGFLKPVFIAERASAICPKAFDGIESVLRAISRVLNLKIFDIIKRVVEELERVLQPILKKIEDIVNEAANHLSKAYCCVTPRNLQIGLRAIGNVLDVATCPVDGLTEGVKKALDKLEDVFNNVLVGFIAKLFDDLLPLDIEIPVVDSGEFDPSSCEFELPSIRMTTFNPLDALVEIGVKEKPSIGLILDSVKDVGKEIRDTCKDAVREIGDGLLEDCCKQFAPLRDGLFCDPTGNIPFKRCSQCTSGKFDFHTKKFHTACGKDPNAGLVKDKVKDLAKDAADASKKIGDGISIAAKKVGSRAKSTTKKIGRRIRKFF